VFATVAFVNRCNATPEEKKKADDLMKELDKPHAEIRRTLMTQLKRIAGELREYYIKRPNHDYAQWVAATPLIIDIKKNTNSGEEPFILTKPDVDDKHIYSNFKRRDSNGKKDETREKYCDDNCIQRIEALPTKIKKHQQKQMGDGNIVHTEMQMLYRKEADNILYQKANEDKVILVYSKYIPCSQNQNSNGGTFVECSGELANFMTNYNRNKNKLIVFYETQHTTVNKFDNVLVSSVVGVSQLYMEMSGIVAFKYTPEKDGSLVRDPLLVKEAAYFREHPIFLKLGRPLMDRQLKATVTQMFIDCVARNSFVTLRDDPKEYNRVQFVAVKDFLSRLPQAKRNELKELVAAANAGQTPTNRQRVIVKGCSVFVNEMLKDCIKNPYIIAEQKKNDFLDFNGISRKQPEFLVGDDQKRTCTAYFDALKNYFNCQTSNQQVCQENCYVNNGNHISNRKNSMSHQTFNHNIDNGHHVNKPTIYRDNRRNSRGGNNGINTNSQITARGRGNHDNYNSKHHNNNNNRHNNGGGNKALYASNQVRARERGNHDNYNSKHHNNNNNRHNNGGGNKALYASNQVRARERGNHYNYNSKHHNNNNNRHNNGGGNNRRDHNYKFGSRHHNNNGNGHNNGRDKEIFKNGHNNYNDRQTRTRQHNNQGSYWAEWI